MFSNLFGTFAGDMLSVGQTVVTVIKHIISAVESAGTGGGTGGGAQYP